MITLKSIFYQTTPFFQNTRGPILESPGNFSGPKFNIQIKIWGIKAQVLTDKTGHFVLLTDSFIMFFCKTSKPVSGR